MGDLRRIWGQCGFGQKTLRFCGLRIALILTAGAPTEGGSDERRQSAYKPRSVPPGFTARSVPDGFHRRAGLAFLPGFGRSSIWTARHRAVRAAYPALQGSEPPPARRILTNAYDASFAPARPCSRRGLPGDRHCCRPRWSLTPPFHPYQPKPIVRLAVVFCGPVRGSPRPGVTRHPAMWSADFPQSPRERTAIARPTDRWRESYLIGMRVLVCKF